MIEPIANLRGDHTCEAGLGVVLMTPHHRRCPWQQLALFLCLNHRPKLDAAGRARTVHVVLQHVARFDDTLASGVPFEDGIDCFEHGVCGAERRI